jgi:hypothetical protein
MTIKEQVDDAFKKISISTISHYKHHLHEFLTSLPAGSLQVEDVAIFIMNLTMEIGTRVYYSIKDNVPDIPLDFDFMKAKIINSLTDSFEKIKTYDPKGMMLQLTVQQIKEIQDNGFAMVTFSDGTVKRITPDDIIIKKAEASKIIQKGKKESLHGKDNVPKIILPGT